MSQTSAVYATKRRRRNGKPMKPQPTEVANSKSNPSKRHRLRLNAELDTLASLLPYEHNILSKLDRLSILRLAVAYLRTKSFFHMSMTAACKEEELLAANSTESGRLKRDGMLAYDNSLNSETFIQALNGFIFILDCEGEVFFSTHNIENFLGFHQSDIIHQSVFELVHSEDREELQRHFLWNSFLPADRASMSLQEALLPDNAHLLERSFTVRFRCLLDNTSGFLRLDVRGRIRQLTGQNRSDDRPVLALFALCTPFGPPSLLETPHKEIMFKSKHRLDMTMVSLDQRGKALLGYREDILNLSGYAMVHHDDLAYLASAHQELLKTGASGLIAYRLQTKQLEWQWLQTSSRLLYKNSKPDFIISTHRPLLEEEGIDLLAKRTMDFKVSYLDPGLTNQYLYDSEINSAGAALGTGGGNNAGGNGSGGGGGGGGGKSGRRHKSQLRDFLTTSRSKRKHHPNQNQHPSPGSASMVDYSADPAAVAAAAAYGQYAAVAAGYPGGYTPAGYPGSAVTAAGYPVPEAGPMYPNQSGSMQSFQTLYPTIENRFLAADGLYYRQLSGYHYPGAEHHYVPHGGYNGLMDMSRSPLPVYEPPHTPASANTSAPQPLQLSGGDYASSVGPESGVIGKYPDDRTYLPRSPYYDSYQNSAIVPSAATAVTGSSSHLVLNNVGLQHEAGYSVGETSVAGTLHDETVPVYIVPGSVNQLHGTSMSQHHPSSQSHPTNHPIPQQQQHHHHPQQPGQQEVSISPVSDRLASGDNNNNNSSSNSSSSANSENSESLSGTKSVISHTHMYGSGNESRQTVLVWSGSSTNATENTEDDPMVPMPLLATATSSSSEASNTGSATSSITTGVDSKTRAAPDLSANTIYSPGTTAAASTGQQHMAAAAITAQQQQQPTPCHQMSPSPLDSSIGPVSQWTPQRAEVPPTSPADAARLAIHPAQVYTQMGLADSWTPYSVGYLPSPQAAEMYPTATARGGTVCCPSLRL